jgi:hypothetical protein
MVKQLPPASGDTEASGQTLFFIKNPILYCKTTESRRGLNSKIKEIP